MEGPVGSWVSPAMCIIAVFCKTFLVILIFIGLFILRSPFSVLHSSSFHNLQPVNSFIKYTLSPPMCQALGEDLGLYR